jgi:hypothetical protein
MGNAEPIVRFEPWDVNRRLTELGEGLTVAVLGQTVERAHAAYAACTPHHPRNFAPITRWGNGIAALRDLLVPLWESMDRDGQPLIVSPAGTAITISGANAHTGRKGDIQPRTSSKGTVTVEAVARNGYLFPYMEAEAEAKAKKDEAIARNTWFLLIHLDRFIGQVRSELSHPTKLDDMRRVIEWSERIILPPFDIDPTIDSSSLSDESPDDGDITIEIKRRA